jgi:sterol desaturase/sphingolipid hydroxylase (fatty acid hydroxylase superfamily)
MTSAVLWFGAGLFVWTFVEYLIHGWLGHRLRTSVSAMHAVHHSDRRRVFAARAWIPTALLWSLGIWAFRFDPMMIFGTGLLCGFIIYEAIHYRIHFSVPLNRWEAALRARHLLHHQFAPTRCYGVTSPIWDVIFRTESIFEKTRLLSAAADTPPLTGRTNLGMMLWKSIPNR